MEQTNKYGFNKPNQDDFYNIEHQNENWDKVEDALGEKANKVTATVLEDGLMSKEDKAKLDEIEQIDFSSIESEIVELADEIVLHKEILMPHIYMDKGIKYRWGFRTLNGQPQFIVEEV
jgi:hypothetical protein